MTVEEFLTSVLVISGILNIILFFKIWGMTNDVRDLKEHFAPKKKIAADEIDVDEWVKDGNREDKKH